MRTIPHSLVKVDHFRAQVLHGDLLCLQHALHVCQFKLYVLLFVKKALEFHIGTRTFNLPLSLYLDEPVVYPIENRRFLFNLLVQRVLHFFEALPLGLNSPPHLQNEISILS